VISQVPWYIARAAGLVSWSLLTASVLWGLTMSTKTMRGRVRPNWLLDLHRYLGGLAAIFTGVHVAAIVADSYTHFGLTSVLVPFASSWHPVAVAWGVVGLYLLLAVELTSLARSRLPNRWWRAIHFASFPLYGVATLHLLTAGSDAGNPLVRVAVIGSTALVLSLTAIRITDKPSARRPTRQREMPTPPRVLAP
jgi:DMSO/TMAO reductase YedYZ heme-binding membrane subunit